MIFSLPLAALGLVAVPALVALYLLRLRSRRKTVSSLLLWRGEPPRRDAGRRLERFAAPLLFWLELAALLLLVTAAAGPRLVTPESRRPLVVVLDDSYSMRAGGDASPRSRAAAALADELATGRHSTATLILAGERPQLLGDAAREPEGVTAALDGWRAAAAAAELERAIALALELGGERARLLVLSDRAPPDPEVAPRLVWRAFGRPLPNQAVVHAVRGPGGDGLLEIANYSERAAETTLHVRAGAESFARPFHLEAAAIVTVRFPAPADADVTAELAGDALAIDDRVVLLPQPERPVRVANRLGDAALRELVDRALEAAGRSRPATDDAELVVHDDAPGAAGDAWTVRLVGGERAEPFLGPFVVDLGHPLSEGLSLAGVIWAAPPPDASTAGQTVVSAGDVPLVVDRERGGAHDVTLRFHAPLSTLQRSPSWPALWWNLLEWRAASLPGLRRPNARLGETVTVTLAPGAETATWRPPEGRPVELPATAGRVELNPGATGVHEVDYGDGTARFAVNALAAAESDLRGAASGRWGSWADPEGELWAERPLGWLFVLLALAVLLLHARTADGGTP